MKKTRIKKITANTIIINKIGGLIFPLEEDDDVCGVVSLWNKSWLIEDDDDDWINDII